MRWIYTKAVVRSLGYSFNAAGMITNVSREDGGWTAYTYDSLDRLTSETQYAATGLTYAANWNYDLAGNRTMAVTNGVTNLYLYAAGNVLTNFGTGTLVQHDAAGNITNLQYSASKKLGLKWDSAYQLMQVSSNGVVLETYKYDTLGRRVAVIAGTTTNAFIYDGPHIIAETSNNVLTRAYTYGPGIDNILAMTTYGAATNTYFYLKDHLGSVHALVNNNGAVVEQYRYTAWGETTVMSSNGTVLAASAYGNRFTWTGREISWNSGLMYFRSRYYAASIGRWLSKDKIGISGGMNLYEYCNSMPTCAVDPAGTCEKSAWEEMAERFHLIYRALRYGDWSSLRNDFVEQLDRMASMRPEELALGFVGGMELGGVVKSGGRLGSSLTRAHINDVAAEMESRGWEITRGEQRGLPEEYLPGPGGARKGSSYLDITATKNGRTLRVNTVDTYADGITPTTREAVNAARIRMQTSGEHLLLVPKPKP